MSHPAVPGDRQAAAGRTWLEAAGPPVLYGIKLSAAVSLALFVAFTLQLDNPSWAGTSACLVCQPVVGASLRKGVFRMIGTVVGAVMAVVLTGLFPQDRVGFLIGMALWAAACSFGGTLSRNFAAYAFALSGYTLAIIAGDSIAEPGQIFYLAISRAAEIVVGIACAMAVMGLTDIGHSPARLAAAIDRIGRAIIGHFTDLLLSAGSALPDGPAIRRGLIGQVAALDPLIDQAIGESPELRHRKAILYDAMAGLFSALSAWRIAESHLVGLRASPSITAPVRAALREADLGRNEAFVDAGDLIEPAAQRSAAAVVALLPVSWRQGGDAVALADLAADRREDLAAARDLASVEAEDVSERLLADAAANLALGLRAAANGLALLRDPARARDPAGVPSFVVADYLPAVVNALRTFLAIGAGIVFWVLTTWPNGLGAITFLSVTVLLLAPQQEKSGAAALGFGIGTVLTAGLAAVTNFALLPNHEGFLALSLIMAAFLVPLAALSTVPALAPVLVAATMNFVPLVGPTNQITFDTLGYYNSALAIVGGCLAGALALIIIPPVPRRLRADRLVALTRRDLRGLAAGRRRPTPAAWQHHIYARLVAMPEGVDAVHGSRLVALLSLGLQVLRLRSLAGQGTLGDEIRASLSRFASRDVDGLLAGLDRVDAALASPGDLHDQDAPRALRLRTSIQVVRDVIRQHRHEFEEGRR